MKSKEDKIKQASLSKTTKAALPFFALFGGQGFASNRNPLTLQSSKILAGESVVYIDETQAPKFPAFNTQIIQKSKSPFARFTYNSLKPVQNARIDVNTKILKYLKKNQLLSSQSSSIANNSGSTLQRKTFSDDWQWSTRISTTTNGLSTCPADLNISTFVWSNPNPSSFYCALFGTSMVSTNAFGTTSAGILAACQSFHQLCDGLPLPVELQKFEIE